MEDRVAQTHLYFNLILGGITHYKYYGRSPPQDDPYVVTTCE